MRGRAGPEALRRLVDATVSVGADLDLRAVLQRVLDAAVDLADARYGALGVLDPDGEGFAELMAGVAIEHARLFEAVGHRERVIAAFNQISSSLLGGMPRDDVLQLIAVSARELIGGALASIVLPDADGGAYVPAADGRFSDAYRGRRIPFGRITRRLLATRQPGAIENLSADLETAHLMEGLGPALFVPIALDGPFGCLVVCGISGDPPFRAADLELLEQLAGSASVVFDYHLRRQREAEFARAADQARIAENLQDSAIQEMFAASLKLSGAAAIAEVDEVRVRITEAIQGLDRAIALTRRAIFDLKTTT